MKAPGISVILGGIIKLRVRLTNMKIIFSLDLLVILAPGEVVTLEGIVLLQEVVLGVLEAQVEMVLEIEEIRGGPRAREEMTLETLILGPIITHHRQVEISKQPQLQEDLNHLDLGRVQLEEYRIMDKILKQMEGILTRMPPPATITTQIIWSLWWGLQ